MLLPVDGLDWVPEIGTGARFDLHERDEVVALRDYVYVAMAVPEPPVAYDPALPGQPTRGDSLTELAEFLIVGHSDNVRRPRRIASPKRSGRELLIAGHSARIGALSACIRR